MDTQKGLGLPMAMSGGVRDRRMLRCGEEMWRGAQEQGLYRRSCISDNQNEDKRGQSRDEGEVRDVCC